MKKDKSMKAAMDAADQKELKRMGAKRFVKQEKSDIKAAKKIGKKGRESY